MAACSRNTYVVPLADPAAEIRQGPPVGADRVWILEQSGPSPSDTTLAFLASAGRTVVMRHQAPDNAVYAVIEFPAGSVTPSSGDSARVTIVPMPGRFGLGIRSTDGLGAGVQVTFSYATHFQAPSDATARYPSAMRFEQAMGAANMTTAGQVQFVPTTRPAADMARFPITDTGMFVLAAPR